ncbi:MAG: SafA/ExsA family spore coat assembly protein [Clostridiales bacterium]|jgi:uncharacterized YkwD family protein/spore coat assembly protein SafA|nr:SafA/ExsA family spore coat assembly protein [Clostridiales bacterium]HOK82531.1 SafA/ExsA family spore coat assembly protein [Clostridia bacterium]HOL61667.1 SafA/ExsA family spore coat assembly protein [Clostridia bacterium]HPO54301.1 SafA/ExsA family spore coat assembly protein [Clostridia bacterium]
MKHKRLAIVLTAVLLSAIASLSISSPAAFAYEEKCGISENESLETAATTYTVQKGDSLWKIAVKYEVGISELIAANPQIANPALIYPGQKISIPNAAPLKSIEDEIVRLVNIERSKNGLAPLTSNWQAARCARIKSQEMIDKNYFSHTSPTYGSPFKMMESFGLRFSAAAENIAYGQRTAQEVMNSWMNSPGHRANILSKSYTQIGVGVAKKSNGTLYFTQMFLKPY